MEAEDKIVVPDGGSEHPDIEAETEDPKDELWLLDTENGIYPKGHWVDFVKKGAIYGLKSYKRVEDGEEGRT